MAEKVNLLAFCMLQRFLMGLKTSISRQLLLRGRPDTLEKAIVAAMEIRSVFAIESNPAENVNPVSLVREGAGRDTGLQVALKELTERLGNLEAKIQSVVQCSVAAGSSKTKVETGLSNITEQE